MGLGRSCRGGSWGRVFRARILLVIIFIAVHDRPTNSKMNAAWLWWWLYGVIIHRVQTANWVRASQQRIPSRRFRKLSTWRAEGSGLFDKSVKWWWPRGVRCGSDRVITVSESDVWWQMWAKNVTNYTAAAAQLLHQFILSPTALLLSPLPRYSLVKPHKCHRHITRPTHKSHS